MKSAGSEITLQYSYERKGLVLSPNESEYEKEGVLNPGVIRDRTGTLLLFPRMVAAGNVSRIGLARAITESGYPQFERLGFVLEPTSVYEKRSGGHGCEDPRITFIEQLDMFVMAYTAFGEYGPRIAVAISEDAYTWTRLGLVVFSDEALNALDNKDGAFFPEPVLSPSGELSIALYHRPMLAGGVNGQTPIPVIQRLAPEERESTAIAYIPLSAAKRDITKLCHATESVKVIGVDDSWGMLKNGAGTPPVRIPQGWLSFYHGVDAREHENGPALSYQAGIIVHDIERPHLVRYRSQAPVLGPATPDELFGIVDDVVFPTGIDVRENGEYDMYYGAADARVALATFSLNFSVG
jgi:predicted GH43/DUF377 family glycosyl hydrolase